MTVNRLSTDLLRSMLARALADVSFRADEFSALDALTGDGDHGQAIVNVLAVADATAKKPGDLKAILSDIGFNIMLETSGSTSTLYGAFFLGMADAAVTEPDAQEFKTMMNGALAGVRKNTKAGVGDKTMMDALIPAVEAIEACESQNIGELLHVGAEAAKKGAEATVAMKANFGRSRNYSERSIGTADAGASSCACIFGAFYNALH